MANGSSSSGQYTYANIGVPSFFDVRFGDQQILNDVNGLYDKPNVSGFIQNAQDFPIFGQETVGPHDQVFHYSHSVNQEQVQSHFSANLSQSPFPIDLWLTGDTVIPRHQAAPIGMIHFPQPDGRPIDLSPYLPIRF
jgi:hypothetical protein